jgi:hypothetical protein
MELYIYTVRYRYGIKIPGFLRNVSKIFIKNSKKILKIFKLISSFKKNYFRTYNQILKVF